MRIRHPAHEALPVLLGHRHGQARRLLWRLAGGEHDLGDATPEIAAQVEPGLPPELVQLDAPQLGQRLVLGELARDEPAQHVSQSPSRTSRIRCQCVPAQ